MCSIVCSGGIMFSVPLFVPLSCANIKLYGGKGCAENRKSVWIWF